MLVLALPVTTWRGGHPGGRREVGVSWIGWESKSKGTEASTFRVWDWVAVKTPSEEGWEVRWYRQGWGDSRGLRRPNVGPGSW